MVFSSFEFILYFLPAFLIIYFLTPFAYKNVVIFVGSLVFYYFGVKDHPAYVLLMLLSVVFNYFAARTMDQCTGIRERKKWLWIGMAYNIGCLFLFKYLDFFYENLNVLLGLTGTEKQIPPVNLVLPIGISFYTFQISSYLMDVYKKKIPAEYSILKLGTYICMFPQLIAGPIVSYVHVQKRLKDRVHSFQRFEEGFREFTIGLAMKVLIANRVGGLWTQIGSIGYESISTPLAWLGIAAFSFQIYFDFYGYSLMAKGLGHLMGFYYPDNFRDPYTARSMTEFWRRWHITLGEWFKEYVYIPLGGNRRFPVRNLFVVWLLTGLWHGASWNYVLWGMFCFLLILMEKAGFAKILERKPFMARIYMLFIIPISWLLFAIPDLGQMMVYFGRLFPFFGAGDLIVFSGDFMKYGVAYIWPLLAAAVCSTGIPRKIYEEEKYSFPITCVLVFLFWGCIYSMYIGLDDPFLYYQF